MRLSLLMCLMVPTVISQDNNPTVLAEIFIQDTFEAIENAVKDWNKAAFLELKHVENSADNQKVLKIMESYKGLKFISINATYSIPGCQSIFGQYRIAGREKPDTYYLMMKPNSASPSGWKIKVMTSDKGWPRL